MSLIIDQAVLAAVSLYSRGQADVAAVKAKIASAADKKTQGLVLQALFDLSNNKPTPFSVEIKWNKSLRALYETLSTEYTISSANVAQVVQKQFIPFPEAPKKSSPLDLDEIVSRLISTSSTALTEAHFKPLQTCRDIQKPLEVCISAKSPGVIQSLAAADQTLGRVTSLKITNPHFTSEELAGLVNACPELDTLYIAECETFTDATIEAIKWPKTLSVIRLPTSKIEHGFQSLANACPALARLTVYGSDCHRALMSTQWPESLIDISYDPYWADDNDFTVVNECLAVDKPSVVALTIGAVALFESETAEKLQAIKWIEQACSDNPNFIPAGIAYIELYRVGILGIKQDLQKAREKLDRLLWAFPSHPVIMACNARLMADCGKHDEAYTQAKLAYELAPHDDYVLSTFANVLLKAGSTPLARDLCTRALVYNPNNVLALLVSADMDAYAEQYPEAEEKCRKAVRINCENQDALFGLAMVLELSQEDITLAKGFLDTLVQINPDSARGHFELAKIYYLSLRDNAQARVHLERAYALQPKDAELVAMYAELLSKGDAHDLQLATRLFDELKELTDGSLQSQVKRARTRDLEADLTLKTLMYDVAGISENRALALEKCEKAYSLTPNDPTVLCMLGELLLSSDTARGLELLESIAESGAVAALLSLGKYYMFLDPERALEFFERALKIEPNNVQVNIAFAKFEIARNNQTVAQKYIEKALSVDPNNAQANVVHVALLTSAQLFKQAADSLRHILANTKFGSDTRQDIVVLLLEDQYLLKQIGEDVLVELLKGSK